MDRIEHTEEGLRDDEIGAPVNAGGYAHTSTAGPQRVDLEEQF